MSDLLEPLKRGSPSVEKESVAAAPRSQRLEEKSARTRPAARKKDRFSDVGCLFIGLAFAAFGTLALWLFFSGAPLKRGSPLAPLVYGIMFSLVGLLMLAGWFAGRRR